MKSGRIICGNLNNLIDILFKYVIIKIQKETTMATTNSTTVKTLQETVDSQKKQISTLLNRVSELSDRIYTLTSDLDQFKGAVAKDVTYLTQRVDGTS
tara:strand:- start:498 stop:791 length:294 start_codon:yes stop_codon:yes gene_type:complete